MKRVAASLLVVSLASSYAFAGTVDFGPKQSVELGAADMTATFPVSIIPSDLDTMVSLRTIFASDDLFIQPPDGSTIAVNSLDPTAGSGFQADGMIGLPGIITPVGFLGRFTNAFIDLNNTTSGSGINFEAVNLLTDRPASPITPGTPIFIGNITVDAAGLGLGTYSVEVRGGDSVLTDTAATADSLVGSGLLNVVPEPATLMLLGIGGLAALRRRRS